jgi:hypothetical protein
MIWWQQKMMMEQHGILLLVTRVVYLFHHAVHHPKFLCLTLWICWRSIWTQIFNGYYLIISIMVTLNQSVNNRNSMWKNIKTVVTHHWIISLNWKIINVRIFPHYFYTFSLWQSDRQKKLNTSVMIDTVLLCGAVSFSNWDHVPLEASKGSHLADAYWQWNEEQFGQSMYDACILL